MTQQYLIRTTDTTSYQPALLIGDFTKDNLELARSIHRTETQAGRRAKTTIEHRTLHGHELDISSMFDTNTPATHAGIIHALETRLQGRRLAAEIYTAAEYAIDAEYFETVSTAANSQNQDTAIYIGTNTPDHADIAVIINHDTYTWTEYLRTCDTEVTTQNITQAPVNEANDRDDLIEQVLERIYLLAAWLHEHGNPDEWYEEFMN